MEIKLNLKDERDLVELFNMITSTKDTYENDNYRRIDMIELLEGVTNQRGQARLENESFIMKLNNEKIEIFNRLLAQLEPAMTEYFQKRDVHYKNGISNDRNENRR